MKLLLKLAWRNIWRNKRRSALTILAITFATFLTIADRGISVGTWEFNVQNMVELFSGYLQIQRIGYQANPSLSKSFIYPGEVEPILRNEPTIRGYAPRVLADGLISFHENSSGAAIFGIDPDAERKISRFHKRLNAGKFFDAGSMNEVVLGEKLAENLRAKVGDTLVVLAQGCDGVLGNQLFRISGTVKLGIPEFDAMAVFMGIKAAQELLAMEGHVNVVALSVKNLDDVNKAQRSIGEALRRSGQVQLAVLTWEEVLPELKQSMEFDQISDWFFLAILIIVVTFGILNTVLMSVTERFREFGVTLSIGMQSRKLVQLVFLETAFIAIIGTLVGNIVGYGVNSYFARSPITLAGDFAAMYEEYGFIPQIVSSSSLNILLSVTLVILVIAFLSCLYPAYKVSKLEPLKGLRYT